MHRYMTNYDQVLNPPAGAVPYLPSPYTAPETFAAVPESTRARWYKEAMNVAKRSGAKGMAM
jgi:hypothetical protein